MAMTEQNANYGQLQGAYNQARNANAPVVGPTVAGAIGKVEGVNTRLMEAVKALESIHDQVGGPRAVADGSPKSQLPPSGAINRLHNAADHAHDQMAEIQNLISSIARMLG